MGAGQLPGVPGVIGTVAGPGGEVLSKHVATVVQGKLGVPDKVPVSSQQTVYVSV